MLSKALNPGIGREDVVAIIVTYRPDCDILDEVVGAIRKQVRSTVIIDNGANTAELQERYNAGEIYIHSLGDNKGIAEAHNIGIGFARSKFDARYVLLLDQDSIASDDMVEKLVSAIEALPDAGCVGPRYFDERQNNPPPFIQIKGLRVVRQKCRTDNDVVPVDYLVTSGCLIPIAVLDKVGGMRSDFFIDYVDIEWGLRAKRSGYQSYGVCAAEMRHNLGDAPVRFLGKIIPIHSPLRHYYHFRNAVVLYKESWVPLGWRVVDAYRLILKYVFYSVFARPRWMHFKMMTIGVWHGIVGKMGKYQDYQDIAS